MLTTSPVRSPFPPSLPSQTRSPSIILLAFILASGCLLLVLSCALFQNWWPLLGVLMYALSVLPKALFKPCIVADGDVFGDSGRQRGCEDAACFLQGAFVTSGVALPLVLGHVEVIRSEAMIMSLVGGLLIYATLVTYSKFFGRNADDEYNDLYGGGSSLGLLY